MRIEEVHRTRKLVRTLLPVTIIVFAVAFSFAFPQPVFGVTLIPSEETIPLARKATIEPLRNHATIAPLIDRGGCIDTSGLRVSVVPPIDREELTAAGCICCCPECGGGNDSGIGNGNGTGNCDCGSYGTDYKSAAASYYSQTSFSIGSQTYSGSTKDGYSANSDIKCTCTCTHGSKASSTKDSFSEIKNVDDGIRPAFGSYADEKLWISKEDFKPSDEYTPSKLATDLKEAGGLILRLIKASFVVIFTLVMINLYMQSRKPWYYGRPR